MQRLPTNRELKGTNQTAFAVHFRLSLNKENSLFVVLDGVYNFNAFV